jgi:hypothetical protein
VKVKRQVMHLLPGGVVLGGLIGVVVPDGAEGGEVVAPVPPEGVPDPEAEPVEGGADPEEDGSFPTQLVSAEHKVRNLVGEQGLKAHTSGVNGEGSRLSSLSRAITEIKANRCA